LIFLNADSFLFDEKNASTHIFLVVRLFSSKAAEEVEWQPISMSECQKSSFPVADLGSGAPLFMKMLAQEEAAAASFNLAVFAMHGVLLGELAVQGELVLYSINPHSFLISFVIRRLASRRIMSV